MLTKQTTVIHKLIPQEAKSFFVKASALLVLWLLLYHGLLKQGRMLDAPLTVAALWGSAQLLDLYYGIITIVDQSIYIDGKYAVSISDPCNALELYVLYAGFLFCIKTSWKRIFVFVVVGVGSIYLLNILRCAGLAHLNVNRFSLVDFAHHYAFKMVIYIAIFLGWVLYVKKEKIVDEDC